MITNFFYNIFFNHPKFFITLFFIIFISFLDNIAISFRKYKDQKKFMNELFIERQRYEMIIEELDEIIFDYNVTEKKILLFSNMYKIILKKTGIQNLH